MTRTEEFFFEKTSTRAAAPRTELDELIADLRARPRSDQMRSTLLLEGPRSFVVRRQTTGSFGVPITGGSYASVVVR